MSWSRTVTVNVWFSKLRNSPGRTPQRQRPHRIPGAKARLLSLERVLEAQDQADGGLRFNGIVPGIYDLEVSARGFQRRIYPQLHIPGNDSEPMVAGLNIASQPDHCGYVNTIDYEAFRAEANKLSGYVLDEDTCKGIGGVNITVNAPSGAKIGAAISGPKGSFALHDLPPGRHRVLASKNAYEPTEMKEVLVPRENLTILHLSPTFALESSEQG